MSGERADCAERATSPASAWRPWAVASLAGLLFFYGFFQRIAPSVMIDPLMRDLAVGGALLGNLSALYFYLYAALQIPGGLLHDRFGPRRVLTFGALLCGSGAIVFSLADSLTLAYLGRLMIGGGAAFAFIGALTLATRWFPPHRFALVSGLTMMAGMLGGVIGQAPLAAAVDLYGWRPAQLWSGLFGLALALAIWLVVRDRPETPAPEQSAPQRSRAGFWSALGQVVGNPANLLIGLTGASMSAPLLAFAGLWAVAWLMQIGDMSRPGAAATASLLLVGWAAGSPLAGWLSDRIGRRQEILVAGALLGLCCLSILVYLQPLPILLSQALFLITGLGLGTMVAGFALVREYNAPEVAGAAFGFVNGSVVAAGAVFQPLVGWLLDLQWRGEMAGGARVYDASAYQSAFTVLIVFLGCGLVAALALGRSLRRLRPAA